jgi:hypothetical protein
MFRAIARASAILEFAIRVVRFALLVVQFVAALA